MMRTRDARRFVFYIVPCVACCALGCREPRVPPTTESALPANASVIDLTPGGADVWAWHVNVRAVASPNLRLQSCLFRVGSDSIFAAVAGNIASVRIPLSPGENIVQARCQSGERTLTSRAVRYVAMLADRPTAIASATISDGQLELSGAGSTPSEHSRAAITHYEWFERDEFTTTARALDKQATLSIPLASLGSSDKNVYVYELQVSDARKQSDRARVRIKIDLGKPAVIDSRDPAYWLPGSVVYGVVPPLFGNPPLTSVRKALPELAELGVNALWLSPVFETLPGDFGYAVTDYFRVRPDYGTASDLEQLVAEAHRLRMRVLLDLVPNHTSKEHPYFAQAETLGERSHYYGFFARDEHGAATHYFDWEHLPNLNYESAEVNRFMSEVPLHWLRTAQVDGYRVDVAWGVKERRPEFWPQLQAELRRLDPGALLLAEASARDDYYLKSGFDAAYDWTHELGHWAWKDVFNGEAFIPKRLHSALEQTAKSSRANRVFRFLNNNDTGPRFITRHGEALTRVATALLFTVPGIPCLYTFDELGAEFEPYAGLKPLQRTERGKLWQLHRELIRLRQSEPAFTSADLIPLHVGESDEAYIFLRQDNERKRYAIVALNFGAKPLNIPITLPKEVPNLRFRDALGSERIQSTQKKLPISLGAFSAEIYVAG